MREKILNVCAWSGLATSFIYEALWALLSHQEALTLQFSGCKRSLGYRRWIGGRYGTEWEVMARTHILTSFRLGAFVSPTPSIEMGNKKNGEEVMYCTLEYNPCNALTVTGEEGWKSKKNTPVRESCSAYLETHFHFNSMCLFYIKLHVWQTLEGNKHVSGSKCLNNRWSHLKGTTKTLSIWHSCVRPGGDKGKEYFQVAEWTWLLSRRCAGRPVPHLTFLLSLHEDDFPSENGTVHHYTQTGFPQK